MVAVAGVGPCADDIMKMRVVRDGPSLGSDLTAISASWCRIFSCHIPVNFSAAIFIALHFLAGGGFVSCW